MVPPPASPVALVENSELLTAWLRGIEDSLTDLASGRTSSQNARRFHDALPALLDAYAGASEEQRTATRVSFSRFAWSATTSRASRALSIGPSPDRTHAARYGSP